MVWKACPGSSVACSIPAVVTASEEFVFCPTKTSTRRRIKKRRLAKPRSSLYLQNRTNADEQNQFQTNEGDKNLLHAKQKVGKTPVKPRFVRRNALPRSKTSSRNTKPRNNKQFDQLLQNELGLAAFRGFLKLEHSEDNLEFWLECQNYKLTKDEALAAHALKIADKHLCVSSPHQVNLSYVTCKFARSKALDGRRDAFDKVQRRIYELMSQDSFVRFAAKYLKLMHYIDSLNKLTNLQKENPRNRHFATSPLPKSTKKVPTTTHVKSTGVIQRRHGPLVFT